jgi:hypothetical protein
VDFEFSIFEINWIFCVEFLILGNNLILIEVCDLDFKKIELIPNIVFLGEFAYFSIN